MLGCSPQARQQVFLSGVRGHVFSLKHITLLPKLSEGFSPTESEESTGGGGGAGT